jgi:hypothetical protein
METTSLSPQRYIFFFSARARSAEMTQTINDLDVVNQMLDYTMLEHEASGTAKHAYSFSTPSLP